VRRKAVSQQKSAVSIQRSAVSVQTEKAFKLPRFGPGIRISVPLGLWPAYADIYHLNPQRYDERTGTLHVKRMPPEKGKTDEQ
jgi:hypothetical protein